MPSACVTIVNPLGLHARPASLLAETASRFSADVTIRRADRSVDGKSILKLLTLSASCGTDIRIETTGPDAEQALEALADLVRNGFGEPP